MTDPTDTTVALATDEVDEVPDRLLHQRGCPRGKTREPVVAKPGVPAKAANSVETYPAIRPGVPAEGVPPREITVERCVDCGAHFVKESSA